MGNADRLSEAIAGLEGEGTEERGHKNVKSRTYNLRHSHRPTPLFGKCCFAPFPYDGIFTNYFVSFAGASSFLLLIFMF